MAVRWLTHFDGPTSVRDSIEIYTYSKMILNNYVKSCYIYVYLIKNNQNFINNE